jgi:outer membrane PBP1 activator LpoA protein
MHISDMPLLLGGYEQQREQIALLWPQTQGDLLRLFALGYDAVSLAGNLPQMRKLNAMQQPGMSGQLSVDPQGNIVRMLDWATYQNGKLVSDSAAPQLEDATHEEATDTTSPAVVEPVAVGSDEQGTTL